MKILIIRMFPNNIDINTYNVQEIGLAKSLIKNGHQCDVMFFNGNNDSKVEYLEENENKIKIYRINGKKILGNAIYNKEIKNIIKQYDVVQSEEYYQFQNIMLYRKLKNKLTIYHGPYFYKDDFKTRIKMKIFDLYVNIFERKYKKVKIITKSKLAERFLNDKGYNNTKTIGVGLDANKLKVTNKIEAEDSEKIQAIKEFKEDNKIILYIGQFEKRRNVDFIINVFDRINKENPKFKLVLIGKGKKEYVNMCKKLIEDKGLNDKSMIIDKINQKNISKVYELADLFVLPTSYEIFGMVLLEAMYYGLPIITTYNGGASTVIKEGHNGYVCNKLDIELWTDKILNIFKDESKVKIISENEKKTIKDKFLWDKLANEFIKVYIN